MIYAWYHAYACTQIEQVSFITISNHYSMVIRVLNYKTKGRINYLFLFV